MVAPTPGASRPAEDQYRRMYRSFEKLEDIATDHPLVARGGYQADDAARDFFSDAYHLKDYLKKHPGLDPDEVERFVASSRPLRIAGDVAHLLKHGGPARAPLAGAPLVALNTEIVVAVPMKPGGEAKIDFGGRNPLDGDTLRIDRTPGSGYGRATVVVTVGTDRLQGYGLAKECLADWNRFLAQRGITFSRQE
jgi:hypothetical protein